MGKLIQFQNLMEADILLYHGSSWVSRAIRFFDGTEFNHASIYVGGNNVTEAIAQGVVKRNIDTSVNNYKPVIIMRLINRPDDMTPVIKKSQEYEGNRYAYEQLLLLVLICSFRKVRLNNAVARFIGKILEGAASILLRFTRGGKEALICSELVYRCYDEAIIGYNDPYTIYLERERLSMKSMGFKAIKEYDYSSISENSIVSYFYGVNRISSFNKLSVSPFLEHNNISDISTLLENDIILSDKELEGLFNKVIDSYVKEDYQLDKVEEIKLKRSLDLFATANFYAKTRNKAFIAPENVGDILSLFLRTIEDFVTPGDLFKAKNLQNIGNIK